MVLILVYMYFVCSIPYTKLKTYETLNVPKFLFRACTLTYELTSQQMLNVRGIVVL